jgi:hypothetical protein
MSTVKTLLLLLALVLFLVAAYPPATARVNLLALGLASWVASLIIP